MPPSMSAPSNETPNLTKDDLSDDAIELLYDIVRRAQSTPDRSSRALFNAYEEVLGDHGLGPEDDSVLHRFLFRMQKDRKREESLVQRFRRVLGEIGIQVECDSEGEGIEVTTGFGDSTRDGPSGAQNPLGRHERRGSFDSFFDGSADKVAGPDIGQELPLRSRRGSRDANGSRWTTRRSRSDTEAQSYSHAQLPIHARVSGYGNRRTASEQHRPSHRRSGSVSSRGSLQIRRDGQTGTSQFRDYDADDSEHTERTADIDLSHIQIPGVNAPIPDMAHEAAQQHVPEPYRPSDTRLMDDAEAFEQQRLHTLARACMQKWRDRTRDQIEREADMNRRAVAFDRRGLLKPALDTLRVEMHNRRTNRETERFFGRLERRAEKARNLFLLTKAFTHWAKSAEDEVQRTSVARRHILRTRFFNGWREITAVNELKIQHFVLGKFLDKWRRRTAAIKEKEYLSMQLYEDDLARRVFKHWFFKFCDIAAPAWHNVRLKRITYEKWHEIATILRDRESWATDRRDRELLRKAVQTWRERTAIVQSLEPQAEEFRRRALLTNALSTLRKEAQLAPLVGQFRARVDTRIARSVHQTWHRSTQLSRQARNVDQMRILRNAWTAWNDRLRIKALEERINDRVLVETMYRWTLASRVSLFQRVHDRNLKESVLLTWVTRTNEQRNTLESAERRFAQFKREQLLRTCLGKIETATAERRAEEFAVVAEYEQKLKQRVFDKLLDKHDHFQQLNKWAGDARFYVLTTHALNSWNQATQHARRNRRREVYAHVRRTIKMNLVRKAFGVWKEKANEIAQKNRQAQERVQNRTGINATILFTHWHDRTTTVRGLGTRAIQSHSTKLQVRYLQSWTQRLRTLQTMSTKALALRQESTELAAASALKKLGWRLWNIQRQEENALALHQRNFEKHLRAMIRFWYEQTAERMTNRPVSPTPTSRSRPGRRDSEDEGGGDDGGDEGEDLDATEQHPDFDDDAGDDTRRLEAWTAFDTNLDLSLSLSPQPASRLPPPPPPSSIPRSLPTRPQTFPQPQSILRPPPAPIPEDLTLDDPAQFWTSTPMPPPTTVGRPGYLKTPSKRSVVRGKRPELPPSPEKRGGVGVGLIERERAMGVMSAPPAAARLRDADRAGGVGGVTSFERRLREGGFGSSMARGTGRSAAGGSGGGRGRGKGRVGFGDVSHFG
ncbi:Sfi1-domain-containing protein [Trematosphaeria pertusa]|uniref:Sfi1-domain-containing protein n=1 Tax=Trematosphaeria pertusa TaxID=390896 RepID=A0A6A6IFI6_9PLEO|nr:Sfi1-domain-containing protein [Trematosphaeria pertusa]KAF2249201.1 Sfi1-domain-containing protein [Trematosphaeria pertusa]